MIQTEFYHWLPEREIVNRRQESNLLNRPPVYPANLCLQTVHLCAYWRVLYSVQFLELHSHLKQNVNFDVLLTVHLSVILVINQLNAQIRFSK